MRELPEIETIRRDLERDIAGRKVKTVEAASMSVLPRYNNRKSFTKLLDGVKITSVERSGMHLRFVLDNDATLVITLGPSALLRRHANKDATEPGTEVVIGFTQGGQLRLIDAEGESEAFVVPTDELVDALPDLVTLGLDPLEQPVSWTTFGQLLAQTDAKLKTLLMDDTFIVGIGEVYADEILFDAGLRFDRSSRSLSTQEIRRLYRSLVETLHDAVKYRGTSLSDDNYVDVFGEPGGYGEHLQVYGREGELSPRSRSPILRVKFGGRWTYYCETQV